jgi:hypothetical protein
MGVSALSVKLRPEFQIDQSFIAEIMFEGDTHE